MILEVQPEEILRLQGGAGRLFTRLVDSLIFAEFRFQGVDPTGAVRTNLRTTIPDGGVDTEVRHTLPNGPSSLVDGPSVWQYKAQPKKNLRTGDLLEGDYLQERIREGDALHVALADSMPAKEVRPFERELLDAVRGLNPDAPPPVLLTADDLARWASQYPAIVLEQFRPGLVEHVLHMESWGKSITSLTPTYVHIEARRRTEERIRSHVALDVGHQRHVSLLIQGASGVGKTRTVYEALDSIPEMAGLVLYVDDDPIPVARALANSDRTRAILVADDCSAEDHLRLKETLGGHSDRVRVIAVNNEPVRVLRPDPELRVVQMGVEDLESVLEQNFAHVDPSRRRAYAGLAQGFPRFAADLCRHDDEIRSTGNAGVVIPSVQEYLGVRLVEPAQRDAVNLLSLFTKVGFRADVDGELPAACELVGLDLAATKEAMQTLRTSGGFVVRGGRYYYLTPPVIADAALEEAWIRWVADDPDGFLGRLPEQLQRQFIDRIANFPNEEVRRICGDYFRSWVSELTPADLSSTESIDRFIALVDTQPEQYLPRLRQLIEDADEEHLEREEPSFTGEWGARRKLVWLAERMAQLPEFFEDAERMLLRLALTETEPDIGNNATAIWIQLYRIILSGTAVPFDQRLARLRSRLAQDRSDEERRLAVRALDAMLETHVTRTLGPAVVAGRIPPPEWRPDTRAEEQTSYESAVGTLVEVIRGAVGELREVALSVFVRHVRSFLNRGLLDEIREVISEVDLSESLAADALEAIDIFVQHDLRDTDEGTDTPTYADAVRAWRSELIGTDLRSRLVYQVASGVWSTRKFDRESWEADLIDLANDALEAPEAFREELTWLTSEAARSAAEFGRVLGREDTDAIFLDELLEIAPEVESLSLIRGYMAGHLQATPSSSDRLGEWLDTLESGHPLIAADLAHTAPEALDALGRVLRLFDQGDLPPRFLNAMWLFRGEVDQHPDELEAVFARLAQAARRGVPDATRIGCESMDFILRRRGDTGPDPMLGREGLRVALWILVEEGQLSELRHYFAIPRLIVSLAHFDPERAVRVAGEITLTEEFGFRLEEDLLAQLAAQYPRLVLDELGRWMVSEEYGWKFFVGNFKSIIAAIPSHVTIEWLSTRGVAEARAIARHLPEPRIEDGMPEVPELTEWVLTQFEEDDRVYREFSAGVGSFRMYRGDIAGAHEEEARVAEQFLDHPLRRIREWAEVESRSAREWARRERMDMEEQDLL